MSADRPDDDWEAEDRPRRREYHYDDEPRRRRSSEQDDYDDEYAAEDKADAMAKVAIPAIILIIGSLLSIILSLGLIAGGIFAGLNAPKNEDQVVGFVYAAMGVFLVPYFLVILLGAVRMKNLRSHTFVMVCAIMAISSIACFGLCGLFVMPFGIWALVVLLNPDVKRQFMLNTYRVSDEDAGV